MADIDFDEFDDMSVPMGTGRFQNIVNWAGALTSVALIAGLAVWGYKLAVRDVTGVPVVRAVEGPMRVAPEHPGGLQAEHQGLAVNSVTAEGGAASPADRLVLAPRPIELTDDDQPRHELRPLTIDEEIAPVATVNPDTEAADPLPEAPTETVISARATPSITAPDPVAATLALADNLTADASPLDLGQAKIIPASVPGVSRSARPSVRPEGDLAALAALAAAKAIAAKPAPVEISASSVSAGANLVQLGAYDSAEVARAEWQRISARFSSFMEGKQRVVQSAKSGGKTFYRLRAAGFSDIADARRFCAALTAERADCIPVVAR